ncbi:MAG: hypothetical protein ABF811_00785 [Pseudoclavibacter sp.]
MKRVLWSVLGGIAAALMMWGVLAIATALLAAPGDPALTAILSGIRSGLIVATPWLILATGIAAFIGILRR